MKVGLLTFLLSSCFARPAQSVAYTVSTIPRTSGFGNSDSFDQNNVYIAIALPALNFTTIKNNTPDGSGGLNNPVSEAQCWRIQWTDSFRKGRQQQPLIQRRNAPSNKESFIITGAPSSGNLSIEYF
ncbi:hypothetical protein BDM02DRAFT_3123212 [Thelephora ganbajun]|uniref:Uncharacterized protein n=1 Tax=Thelephora ganbajun TaxID=370292 RepID=A0ACB6Z2V6_THEGA|nr:hypothetical protein BDM02DRAFT_3123212 [Thelephora ganbajun]